MQGYLKRVVNRFWTRAAAAKPTSCEVSPPAQSGEAETSVKTAFDIELERWGTVQGDKTLRLQYSLTRESVVLDIGGYEGQWASDLFARYLCQVHIFEPVPNFARNIRHRFAGNPNIRVHAYGLAASDRSETIAVAGQASSAIRQLEGASKTTVELRCAERVLNAMNVPEFALVKINIEGGEYELLQHLIDTGLITRIRNLQIQFHNFVRNAESRLDSLQRQLAKSHDPTYQFRFVWENWRLKE